MRTRLSIIFLLVAACQPTPVTPSYEVPRYNQLQRVPVNAATFTMQQRYHPPMHPPYVDHQLPIPIATAITRWIQDRVMAAGADGTVTFTIVDAHIVEEPLKKTSGIKGLFTTDQTIRFTGQLVVEANLHGSALNRHATAEAHATVTRTLEEGATSQQRTALLHEMMQALMASFNTNMAEQLRLRFR